METTPTQVTPTKARKRIVQRDKWKVNVAKRLRYAPKEMPEYPGCKHDSKTFKCGTLKMIDIQRFYSSFYASRDKVVQDTFILKYITTSSCTRRRPRAGTRQAKDSTIRCFLPNNLKDMVPVCKNTFMKVLGITKHRIAYVANHFKKFGTSPREMRGGDRKSKLFASKTEVVCKFISSLKCVESHYCRSKTGVCRKYLPSHLSIAKLYRAYSNQCQDDQRVKSSYFRKLFNTKYNLGFGKPKTDVCSTCTRLSEEIKTEKCQKKRQNLITEKRVHSLKYQAFYDKLRCTTDDAVSFTFDCQKNLVLPKVPDQIAYYSRQLYIYKFAVCRGNSKSPLNPETVKAYTWTEDKFKKGSNEIVSAVFDVLINTEFIEGVNKVRLISDGCPGQNKNTSMLTMCHKWLDSHAPTHISEVELLYPIVGHSFLPPDRVFGHIEREVRKLEVIANPEEYKEIFSKTCTVVNVGEGNSKIFDWKKEGSEYIKLPKDWHFKISSSKIITIRKSKKSGNILTKGEANYRVQTGIFRSILKKGSKASQICPDILSAGVPVKPLKLFDVNKLLNTHYGNDWRSMPELVYYKNIIDPNITIQHTGGDADEEEPCCSEIPEEDNTKV